MTTPPTPAGWYPDPDGSGGQRFWDGSRWTEHRYPAAPTPAPSEERVGAHRKPEPEPAPEPEPEPDSFTQKTEPVGQRFDLPPATPANRKSGPGLWYGVVCAALLAVLVALAVYGFVIKKDPKVQISSPTSTTTEAAPTSTDSSQTTTESATTTAGPTVVAMGDATDGPLSFTVHGIEIGSTVVMADAPVENNADGEFIIVRMTVTNVGTDPAMFLGMFQTLHAGGATYPVDDEATAYLEGTFADLAPGQSADVSIAFDVPPGTPPEAIELHADPTTPGAEVPLT